MDKLGSTVHATGIGAIFKVGGGAIQKLRKAKWRKTWGGVMLVTHPDFKVVGGPPAPIRPCMQ